MKGRILLPYFFGMISSEIQSEIERIIHQVNPEVFIVDLKFIQEKSNVLSIKVDTDTGIQLSDCVSISRKVGKWLEENEVFSKAYKLEVSSPGVGYPLKLKRQYINNIGRALRVLLNDGKIEEGIILKVEEDHLQLGPMPKPSKKNKKVKTISESSQTTPLTVSFEQIKEAKVIII